MATLLVASMSLPSARPLAAVAAGRSWRTVALDEAPPSTIKGPRTFYGGTDRMAEYVDRYELCLIEPPLDLLAKVPADLTARRVQYGTMASLAALRGPVFMKPGDPILKSFDAGVYRSLADIRSRRPLPGDTPVLVSDVVEWTSEFRCFVLEGRIETWSPYLSYGRPTWKPGCAGAIPPSLTAMCDRLHHRMHDALPPAYVVDVGVLNNGQWAIVEFNPAWCSSILGANVEGVFRVIERSARHARSGARADMKWARQQT